MVTEAPAADPTVAPAEDQNPADADPNEGAAQAGVVVPDAEQTDAGTVEEAPAPRSLAEFSDDDLLAHLRERKGNDGQSLEERLRKSERDRTIAEYRKNAAREDNVRKREQRWLEAHGIDPSTVKPSEAEERSLLFKLSEDVARTDVLKAYAHATLDHLGEADKSLAQALIDEAGDDPEALETATSRLVRAVQDTTRNSTLRDVSLADVPEGSKLHADIQAEVQRKVEAELKAQEITEQTADAPPTAPKGSPGVDSTSRYRSMSAADAAQLPREEFNEWMKAQAGAR